jgi:hypothetical protein
VVLQAGLAGCAFALLQLLLAGLARSDSAEGDYLALYRLDSSRSEDQTTTKMRQPKLPEEAPSGIQAARHFSL